MEVTVYRSGEEVVLKLVLDEKPAQQEEQSVPAETQPSDSDSNFPFNGFGNFLWPFFG